MTTRIHRLKFLGLSLVLAAPLVLGPGHAAAQLGGIVYDPTNYAQNVLTAARSLEQINNQIAQIQNQAASLVNEAKNLAGLPLSTAATLQAQLARTRKLLDDAGRIAFNVKDVQQAFAQRYAGTTLAPTSAQMVANADARWRDSVAGFEDALRVQAGVVGNLESARTSIDSLVSASQSASGALQAAQAGNQLLALQAQQLGDLTATLAANGRADALASARSAASEADGRARFRRFLGRD